MKKNPNGKWIPYRELPEVEREKHKVRTKFNTYKYFGLLKIPPGCFWKGCRTKVKIETHHPDFKRPFFVARLCQTHHRQVDYYHYDVSHLAIDLLPSYRPRLDKKLTPA